MKKYIFLIAIVLTLTSCYDTNKSKNNKWTPKAKRAMFNSCMGNEPIPGFTMEETKEYCKCVLQKTIEKYPDPSIIKGDLPDEFVKKAGLECMKEMNYPAASYGVS